MPKDISKLDEVPSRFAWKARRETLTLRHGPSVSVKQTGRGERIRTSGLYVPNVALYQAKLHPVLIRGVLVDHAVTCLMGLRSNAASEIAVNRKRAQF